MALIEFVQGDITQEATDAVVNAANSSLLGGGGVDSAIHRAGGPVILDECRKLRTSRFPDGLPTGHAVATRGGNLRATWVIHTVGPVYDASSDPAAELSSCYAMSLEIADGLGARSVAFPAISTGVYGYPLYEAARVSIRAVRTARTRVERVRFVLFSPEAHFVFRDADRLLERGLSRFESEELVTRDSWQTTKPLPEARVRVSLARRFDAEEHARLAHGLFPQQMEDKWVVYLEEDWLYFHRSWTGICLYAVRLQEVSGGYAVAESWVNRDPEQYENTDADYDASVLAFLIERLLLGRSVAFPGSSGPDDVHRHHVVGYARANDEKL